jgi:hypothetical protein
MSDSSSQSRWFNIRQPPFNYIRLLIVYIIAFTEYILNLGGSDIMYIHASFIL